MAKAAAIIITGIALALLIIYGADAAAAVDNPTSRAFWQWIIKQGDLVLVARQWSYH